MNPADEPEWSDAAAREILALGFSREDKKRMHALAARARAGTLTSNEENEVEAYGRVASLLGILKSRARRALRRHTRDGEPGPEPS